ncbi:hypothetical protein ACWEV4_30465 [Streptomyces sp. NPDC003860]
MSDGHHLANTGLGTITLFGIAVTEEWLLLAAVTLLALGVTVLRLGWRRGRGLQD